MSAKGPSFLRQITGFTGLLRPIENFSIDVGIFQRLLAPAWISTFQNPSSSPNVSAHDTKAKLD